jgi:hypothetical protein
LKPQTSVSSAAVNNTLLVRRRYSARMH